MRWFFKRGKTSGPVTQSASGATAQGPITLISGVRGDVTVVAAHQPAPAGAPEIETVRAQYAARVRQRYGRLDLEVLTPLREQDEHLAVHLRDVFVPQSVRADPPPVELPQELLRRLMDPTEAELLDLPPGIDRETVERVRRAYQARPPQDVLDVLTAPEHDRVVILGHPGAGKSTLARYLTLALTAPEPQPGLEALHGRLPLIVELREYAQAAWRDRSFEDFLVHQHTTEGLGLPSEMLPVFLDGEGPYTSLVIFDGLDELFERDVRDAVARRIAGFAARRPRARIVVTSREYGYQRAVLDGAGFTNFMLQDLDRDRIGAFAEQWYSLAYPEDPDQARKLTERVTSAVDTSAPVRELAGNPLILTILAIIGRRRELPRDRRTVYEHAVDVLVEHWDPSKYLKDRQVEEHLPYLAAEDKHELLRLIARQMQEGHGGISGNHIAGPDLIKSFEEYLKDRYALPPDRAATAARVMLDQFRQRNFILSRFGGEIYGFVHRTFLEYLTATDLAHRFNHERSLSEEDLQDLFAVKVHDPTWHEILLLLVGSLDERFVAGVLDRLLGPCVPAAPIGSFHDLAFVEVLFVARCLAEVRRPGALGTQSTAMVRQVIRLFEFADAMGVTFFHPCNNVTALGPVLTALGENWEGRDDYLEWYDGVSPAMDRDEQSSPVNATYQLTADLYLFLVDASPRAARIVETAMAGGNREVRISAAGRLVRHAGSEPALLEVVERCLREDESVAVRQALMRELTIDSDLDPDLLTRLLVERLTHDELEVRLTALQLFPSLLLDSPAARAAFERACDDVEPQVRRRAVYRLIASSADRTRATALLQKALRDEDPRLRTEALTAVAATGYDDPVARAFVQERLRNDDSVGVVVAAIEAVQAVGSEEPGTHAYLHELTGHEDPEVRQAALRCLAEGGAMAEGLSDLLAHLMAHDEDATVRRTALALFIQHEADDTVVRNAVLDHVRSDAHGFSHDALHLLVQRDRGGVRGLIIDWARNHPDETVRAQAFGHLLAAYRDDAAAVSVVFDQAVGESRGLRLAALQALFEQTGANPDLMALAQDRFAHDPAPDVRLAAFRILVDFRRDDPDLLLLLRQATEDAQSEIRTLAERLLTVLAPHPT
ncbi:HEAT repeat domain-containing protein [Streptomyces sp. NPDC055721]|uniref:HEAT repeat domain-containing protein n=1 Tax=Streptomyces sp. NPDC127132 TaxID=3345374 RepID=UPI0036259942